MSKDNGSCFPIIAIFVIFGLMIVAGIIWLNVRDWPVCPCKNKEIFTTVTGRKFCIDNNHQASDTVVYVGESQCK